MALTAGKNHGQLLVNCINGKSKNPHPWWGFFCFTFR